MSSMSIRPTAAIAPTAPSLPTMPISWTIAASDSSSGAGVQANLKTMNGLGVYCCTALTALTAQNTKGVSSIEPVSLAMLDAQLKALQFDLPPLSINLGLLHSRAHIELICKHLKNLDIPIICDPVMKATSGDNLSNENAVEAMRSDLFPLSELITPNLDEALVLLGIKDERDVDHFIDDTTTDQLIESLAGRLLSFGSRSVLLKGGHRQGEYCQDYFTDGSTRLWLTSEKKHSSSTHGTGCTLSAAIAACLALGLSLLDAIVVAKAYVNQGVRLAPSLGAGHGPLAHQSWPEFEDDLPWISPTAEEGRNRTQFLQDHQIGFYPIVDRSAWLETILPTGVKTVQLRIKDLKGEELEKEIEKAVAISRHYDARLYINDYWQLACKYKSFGVHLGQEDLAQADIWQIQKENLRLGISTHNYAEIARALSYRPSYIAIGPIHHTTTKEMVHRPQGVEALRRWRRSLNYPLVAIGGIFLSNAEPILQAGADSIAVVRDVCDAENPSQRCLQWLNLFQNKRTASGFDP